MRRLIRLSQNQDSFIITGTPCSYAINITCLSLFTTFNINICSTIKATFCRMNNWERSPLRLRRVNFLYLRETKGTLQALASLLDAFSAFLCTFSLFRGQFVSPQQPKADVTPTESFGDRTQPRWLRNSPVIIPKCDMLSGSFIHYFCSRVHTCKFVLMLTR